MRFLIADDHELVRKGMRSIIESRGNADVWEAANGVEAVEMTKKTQFDLVILDISMPVFDGFSVAREIRKTDRSTPILFMSFSRTQLFVDVARKIGANGYLSKSESSSTLLEAIETVLAQIDFFPPQQ